MRDTTVVVADAPGVARDFDVRPSDWVGLFEQPKDGLLVRSAGGRTFSLSMTMALPCIRFVSSDRLVVIDRRTNADRRNGHLLARSGQPIASFCAGDAVQDVVVLEDLIACTYGDEGIFGDVDPSPEGVAFFDFDGARVDGYRSMFGNEGVVVSDCYCACGVDGQTLAFSPYADFPLVRLQPRRRTQSVCSLPRELRGGRALTLFGEHVFLFGAYDRQGSIFHWRPGLDVVEVAKHTGALRGLPNGRFLSVGERGFAILEMSASAK